MFDLFCYHILRVGPKLIRFWFTIFRINFEIRFVTFPVYFVHLKMTLATACILSLSPTLDVCLLIGLIGLCVDDA